MHYHFVLWNITACPWTKPFMVTISQKHHDEEMKAAADQLVFTNLQLLGSLVHVCHWLDQCINSKLCQFKTSICQKKWLNGIVLCSARINTTAWLTIIEFNQNSSLVYCTIAWRDETAIVTTTITTVCNINIYATVATAITTAESEMCGQHCSG